MNSTDALILRSNQMFTQLDQNAAAVLAGLWARLPDHSNRGRDQFIREFVPVLLATQGAVASLTDAYLAAVVSEMASKVILPVGVPAEIATGAGVRNGVPPEIEYQRPFETVWYELSKGKDQPAAVAAGLNRAKAMVMTDVQLARTNAARHVLSRIGPKTGIAGYRRVLTSLRACELCQIASTQRYHISDLMPIHNRCTCGIAPIHAGEDPGQVIDQGLMHPEAESVGENAKGVPVFEHNFVTFPGLTVHQHGEIGPVLTVKGQEFRGPSDIPPTAETAAS